MSEWYQSLSHSKWDCKYHGVFVPKYRRKVMFGDIRRYLGPIFHELAREKECRMVEGHWMPDHVHRCIRPIRKFKSLARMEFRGVHQSPGCRPKERQIKAFRWLQSV